MAFLGGGLAAILVRERRARVVGRHPASAILAVAALFAATLTAPGALRSTMLLTVAFVVIASGNTLFGLLISTPLRTLGAMSYSVYLLHGLVLYLAFSALGKGSPDISHPCSTGLSRGAVCPLSSDSVT